MKKTTAFALAVILCFCLFSGAERAASAAYEKEGERESKHPLDLELERRINADPSTAGMVEAYAQAIADWDKLLNVNYNALMKNLSREQQDKLRASQREWIKYRDLEFDFNRDFHADLGGTIQGVNILAFQCSFVRERALALGAYLEELTGADLFLG